MDILDRSPLFYKVANNSTELLLAHAFDEPVNIRYRRYRVGNCNFRNMSSQLVLPDVSMDSPDKGFVPGCNVT